MHIGFARCFVIALLSSFLFVSSNLSAQNSATTASLIGVVRDATGAIIPDATITLRNLATNQVRQTASSDDGSYRLTELPVGDYEARVEAKNFAPRVVPKVTLALGRATILDFELAPASVNAEVTVTDKPLPLDVTQTATTTSIDPERIEELPVNSRNYLEFTLLAPGVAPSNAQATNGVTRNNPASSGAPLADSGFTFGGLRPRSNAIAIDGLDNTDETTGAARVALSPEIVREFQIVNNGLSAEFGGAAGGAVNVVTRTGANELHGDVFTFYQNEIFNARDPFTAAEAGSRLRFRRWRPGGAIGGAIKRDKIFYYLAAEQEHQTSEDEAEIARAVRLPINAALSSGFAPRLAVRAITNSRFPTSADETEAAGKLTLLAGARHTLNFRFALTNNRERGDAFNADALTDQSARGTAYTKDYQLTGSDLFVVSPKVVNDLRFQASARRVIMSSDDATGAGIEIAGLARFGRPYEAVGARRENRFQAVDNLSFAQSHGEIKTGATVNHVALNADLQEGFGGLFIFRTLADFLAGRPAVWRQAFGDSRTKFGVTSFGAFIQDNFQPRNNLTLNLGARYDVETLPSPFRADKNNFSPRVGAAYSPSKNLVVRAGFGLFYDRLPLAFLNRAIQKDGARAFEQVATDADAARVFALTGGGRALSPISGIAPSIFRADPNFKMPYSAQAHLGAEYLLASDVTVSATYLFTRGVHLPRTRNINLLPPVTLTAANAAALGFSQPTPQQLGRLVFGAGRIDARYDAIYNLEDAASSSYHGLTFALNKRLSNEFELLASYTLSKTIDDASDFDEQPQNPYDARSERALSRQDVRHRFTLSALFDLPFGDEDEARGGEENDTLLAEIFGHIEIAPIISISSGRPVNPLTGADEDHSRAYPLASRPLGFRRNDLRTPRFINFDLRAVKYFPFGERRRLDFVVEAFNLFNHPNAAAINPFYGSNTSPLPLFAAPIAFNSSRQLRFSIDFEF